MEPWDVTLLALAALTYFSGVGLTFGLLRRWWEPPNPDDVGHYFWLCLVLWAAILPAMLVYRAVEDR